VNDSEMSAAPNVNPLTVSVAMRVYNSSRFVGEQLGSILQQEYPPDQIVVGDDGSDDGTLEIVVAMVDAARQARPELATELTLLSGQHVGITANIERTIAACTGDIIVICDHDDRSHPSRFARIRDEFQRRPELLYVHGDADLIDEDGRSMGARLTKRQLVSRWERERYAAGDAFRVLIRRNIATGATAAFRRSLVPLAAPFPHTWVYDEWLGIVAAGMGQLAFIAEPQLDYRQHSSNKQGVRRRGVSEKVGLLLRPGTSRNKRLRARAEVLSERLEGLGKLVPPQYLALARSYLHYESVRSELPRNRLLRAIPVLWVAASGAYWRFARGHKDVVLDLVQPLN
jgi:glycosyltransferase involved in cell wall biosynthesis